MDKYMRLIEQITCLNGYEDDKRKAKMFDEIYMIAHVANGTCKSPHEGRVENVNKLIKEYNNI